MFYLYVNTVLIGVLLIALRSVAPFDFAEDLNRAEYRSEINSSERRR